MEQTDWKAEWREKMEQSYQDEEHRQERLFSQLWSRGVTPSRTREELEAEYGRVWDQAEFERDYWIHLYLSGLPAIVVRRKADMTRLNIRYQDEPRLYFKPSL